jgi:hypothetical protein
MMILDNNTSLPPGRIGKSRPYPRPEARAARLTHLSVSYLNPEKTQQLFFTIL